MLDIKTLSVGQVVRLNSGGPLLTIKSMLDNGTVTVLYVNSVGEIRSCIIPIKCLEKEKRNENDTV